MTRALLIAVCIVAGSLGGCSTNDELQRHALSIRTAGFCSTTTAFRDGATLRVEVDGPSGSMLTRAPMKIHQTKATRCSGTAQLGKVPEVSTYRIHVSSIRGSVVVGLDKMKATGWHYRLGLSVQ